jgi:hypothetical protein
MPSVTLSPLFAVLGAALRPLLGAAWIVLAQAAPGADVSSWPSWIVNGGIGGMAIWAIIWLIKTHTATVEKLTADFRAVIAQKDQQIIDQGKDFKEALEGLHAENRGMLDEMRKEHQVNVEKQFTLSREQVAALEHVTSGMSELKGAVQTLADRVDELDPRAAARPRPPRNPPPA